MTVTASQRSIPFSRRSAAPKELEYVREAIESGRVQGDGSYTKRASALLRERLGAPVLLTTSCTHALELAALVSDVGDGDEVIVPSYTFSSTANAFVLRGATLRFADVDPDTFSMELPQLEAAMTEHTRAVCAVAYGGVLRDAARMAALCKERSITLIEDAAQGLFASTDGRPLGTYGRLGALSFHATKNVSCGEGGALILGDPSLLERAEIVREKGTDRSRYLRGEVDKYTWRAVGSSYLPSDVLAAMLTAQLEAADHSQGRRQAAWRTYKEILAPAAERAGFRAQTIPANVDHPAHLFAVVLPPSVSRDAVISGLREHGIQAVSHFEPLHRAAVRPSAAQLPNTDDLARGLLRLPLYNELSIDDAAFVARALVAVLESRAARAEPARGT
jgi:dTDP-4-amino-4,6-dideoxygalactose transaminase